MTPFIQELVSFISLMLGVIVLTAWVMWILLRPSGDTKVKNFAEESARDGLTQCVMENNDLKNQITRLEREIKVLMSAGYGGAKSSDEGLVAKNEDPSALKDTAAKESRKTPTVAKAADQQATDKAHHQTAKAVAASPVTAEKQSAASRNSTSEAKTVAPSAATDDSVTPLPETPAQEQEEDAPDESSAELKRLIEEAEKQKITDYMASVEKEAERHKKEVEALAAQAEAAEKVQYADNNLKRIKGIGPHLEAMLKKSGITSYQQIAEFTEQDIQRVSDEIGSFPRRIKREGWIEQARKLMGNR